MGRQPDGSFLVSTGQRIEAGSIAFTGRPIDLALHPTKDLFAILKKDSVLLATANGVIKGTEVALGASAGFRGLVCSRRRVASRQHETRAHRSQSSHAQGSKIQTSGTMNTSQIRISPCDLGGGHPFRLLGCSERASSGTQWSKMLVIEVKAKIGGDLLKRLKK